MGFKEDLALEEKCYKQIIKPLLILKKIDSIFIRYSKDESNLVYNTLQKKHDIDIVLDNEKKNFTISIKTVRKIYKYIFFETIKNTNTGAKGWGYYTLADYIFYVMLKEGSFDNYKLSVFKPETVRTLNINKYKKAYGKTYANNILLYATEGRLIPLTDFKTYKFQA